MKYSDISRAQKLRSEVEYLRNHLRECTEPYSGRYCIASRPEDPLIELRSTTSNEDEAAAFVDVREAIRKMLQGRIDSRLAELRDLGIVVEE